MKYLEGLKMEEEINFKEIGIKLVLFIIHMFLFLILFFFLAIIDMPLQGLLFLWSGNVVLVWEVYLKPILQELEVWQ